MIDIIKIKKELYLQRISHQDAEEVFDLIDNNRQHLRVWLPFVDTTYSVNNTHSFIEQLQKPYCREMVFTICSKDSITGLIGFKDIDTANKRLEIGYWISKQDEGKGMVTDACKSLIEKAFSKMNMNRIQIKCGIGNQRSSNIPKRLGFNFEGIERAGEKHKNGFIDLEVYSLLKSDWKNTNRE
ncbi:MAG: GNAT family N-acetyltransferase [Bacteroidales bacterium]|nr:GNAT family N-acetyltransferase [Bacteroidales bacterium]